MAALTMLLAQTAAGLPLPKGVSGFYCLVADDTVANYTSTDDWQPQLYDYQVAGANVVWLTFVNPTTMPAVPPAMKRLAACRGKPNCPKQDVPLIVSIGGAAYSEAAWPFLATREKAEAMAVEVAKWAELGFDGVDLDIEDKAGQGATAAANMFHFARKLKDLKSDFLVTQPVYGIPAVDAENYVVNHGWNATGPQWDPRTRYLSTNLIDSVGIMVYEDLGSLQWVSNYADGSDQYMGVSVNVPTHSIVAGIQGNPSDETVLAMAKQVRAKKLGGYMVWFASVYDATRGQKGLVYGDDGDASSVKSGVWAKAIDVMNH